MIKTLRRPDPNRYGDFFVVPVINVSGRAGKNANKYALMAEDWYVCNCNGDCEYAPMAIGDSPEEVRLWAAASGFTVCKSPSKEFTYSSAI